MQVVIYPLYMAQSVEIKFRIEQKGITTIKNHWARYVKYKQGERKCYQVGETSLIKYISSIESKVYWESDSEQGQSVIVYFARLEKLQHCLSLSHLCHKFVSSWKYIILPLNYVFTVDPKQKVLEYNEGLKLSTHNIGGSSLIPGQNWIHAQSRDLVQPYT